MTTRCWHDHTVLTWPHSVDMTTQCWHDHTVLVRSHSVGMTTQCWYDHTVLAWPHSFGTITQCWHDHTVLTWPHSVNKIISVDMATVLVQYFWHDYKVLIWLQSFDMTTPRRYDYKHTCHVGATKMRENFCSTFEASTHSIKWGKARARTQSTFTWPLTMVLPSGHSDIGIC